MASNNQIKLPRVIFLVGSAGSGKSTIVNIIKKDFPFYKTLNDLEELKRLLKVEENSKNGTQFKILDNGGFDIIDPVIWDEVLVTCSSEIKKDSYYTFEFSRGVDKNYLDKMSLRKNKVYLHSFEIILNNLTFLNMCDMLIIHANSDYSTRRRRNIERKKNGRHFVAESVMAEVYNEDNFYFNHSDLNFGFLNLAYKIPVYSIDNSIDLSEENMRTYLSGRIYDALHHYSQNS